MLLNIQLLTSTLFDITSYSYFYIIFPFYYLPALSRDGSISCYLVDDSNLLTTCSVEDDRTVVLKLFQNEYTGYGEFNILISGITQPFVVTGQSIQVEFDKDNDPTYVNIIPPTLTDVV